HLVIRIHLSRALSYKHDDVLSCHLEPAISAASMEIKWWNKSDLVCHYKDRQMTVSRDYEGRVSLPLQELHNGNVSLTLRDVRRNVQQSDSGDYKCKLFHDRCQKTGVIHLQVRGKLQLLWLIYEITDTQTLAHKRLSERYKRLMEETKQLSERGSPVHTSGKLHSNDIQISILQIIIRVNITVGCLLVSCT
uniref:Ig-like domain-containing protein n=1 Tax=Sinocyclocheilus grahami TaxID=75366 RepID=A0A672KW81_SINGR